MDLHQVEGRHEQSRVHRVRVNWKRDARIADPREPTPQGERPSIIKQARPRPNPPTEYSQIELYKFAEADVFNLIAGWQGMGLPPDHTTLLRAHGDGAPLVVSSGYRTKTHTSAWAAIYLGKLIEENRRPLSWINRAKVKLRELCDFLLTYQCGTGYTQSGITALTGTTDTTELEYGAIAESWSTNVNFTTHDTSVGAYAFMLAYRILGDGKYQTAYRAALTCIRRLQFPGNMTRNWYVMSTSTTGRWQAGMWPSAFTFITSSGNVQIGDQIHVQDIVGFEAIKAVQTYENDAITYGDSTAVGQVNVATAGKLSEMLTTAKTFWTTAVNHSTTVYAGYTFKGFSSTTPFEYYSPFKVNNAGTGVSGSGGSSSARWGENGAFAGDVAAESDERTIGTDYFAAAVRGWYAAFGYDSTLQDVVTNFLFTTNTHASTTLNYPTVTYNPKLALSLSLHMTMPDEDQVSPYHTAVNEAGATYSWLTMGYMSTFMSEQFPSSFVAAKERISRIDDPLNKQPTNRTYSSNLTSNNYRYPVGEIVMPGTRINTIYTTDYAFKRGFTFSRDGYLNYPDPLAPATDLWLDPLQDVMAAAVMGLAYREDPVIHSVRDH